MADREMAATRKMLAEWDASTNPVLLSAAGQLRAALRLDDRDDVATLTGGSRRASCGGSLRTPDDDPVEIGGKFWAHCRGCRHYRALRVDGTVRMHPRVAGLTSPPDEEADRG